MDRKVKEINTSLTSTSVVLYSKSGSTALFDIVGTFRGWDHKKEYPTEIELNILSIQNGNYYHLSKCNFCKKNKTLEIHVEKVDEADFPQNHSLSYIDSKKEQFKFKRLDLDHIYQVDILVYNSDPANPETEYVVCGKAVGNLTHKKAKIALAGFEVHPETSKGNIIVSNP